MPPLPRSTAPPGFTLPELLACLAIVAILGAIAVPAYRTSAAQASLRAAGRLTVSSLHLARQKALTMGRAVTACPTHDGRSCSMGSSRWMMFAKGSGSPPGRLMEADTLIRTWELPARVEISGTRGYASFLPQTSAAATATFQLCHPDLPGRLQLIIVSQTGRVRLSQPRPASSPRPSGCPR